jgi:hypothetical protein
LKVFVAVEPKVDDGDEGTEDEDDDAEVVGGEAGFVDFLRVAAKEVEC